MIIMASNQIKSLDHIGIAVKNIDEHIPYYRDVLQLEFLGIKNVESQKIRTAIFKISNETMIEVFEPTDPSTSIAKFIEKKGEGLHHICFGVTNIEEALEQAKKNNIKLINEKPFIGAKGVKVAFLHPTSTGRVLTEFSETKI